MVIGVHAPEFAFEKDRQCRAARCADLGISYPVALDNDYAIWQAFNNQYWPAHYFIDAQGRIRGHHFGEGDYDESEQLMPRQLLTEAGAKRLPAVPGDERVGVRASRPPPMRRTSVRRRPMSVIERAENFASPGGVRTRSSRTSTPRRRACG